MPDVISCTPGCCTTTPPVNVPGGQGAAGNDGADGVNAYSIVTGAGFSTPGAIGNSATAPVDTTAWMVIGQIIVFDGPATFRITSIPNSTSVTGDYLGYAGDIGVSQAISAGAKVSPSGAQPALTTEEAIGISIVDYDVIDSAYDSIVFTGGGSASPIITLSETATYVIAGRAVYEGVAATYANSETLSLRIRRTNNTAANIAIYPISIVALAPDCEIIQAIPVLTAVTGKFLEIATPFTIYEATANDILALQTVASNLSAPGDIIVSEASIIAVKIS